MKPSTIVTALLAVVLHAVPTAAADSIVIEGVELVIGMEKDKAIAELSKRFKVSSPPNDSHDSWTISRRRLDGIFETAGTIRPDGETHQCLKAVGAFE